MTESEKSAVLDKPIVTKTGREFHLYHKELLKQIPADILQEMAQRELEKIKAAGHEVKEPEKT